jgi:hypothetical protein
VVGKCVIGLYLLYTSQNLLGTIFRVTFAVLYRRIWSIVGNYSILCCDSCARVGAHEWGMRVWIGPNKWVCTGEHSRIWRAHIDRGLCMGGRAGVGEEGGGVRIGKGGAHG